MKFSRHSVMLVFFLVSVAVGCGCGKTAAQSDDAENIPLEADPQELVFESASSSTTFTVRSSSKPSVVSSVSWCKSSVGTFAQGQCSVTVNVEENTSTEQRTAYLSVVCGQEKVKVSISQAAADSVEPEDFLVENTPGDNLAWTMAGKLGMGWNLGNQMDSHSGGVSGETLWGNGKATQETFNSLKAKGFSSVRIPITWMGHIGEAPEYKLEESWLARVEELVGYARNAGLYCIINVHHDGADNNNWLNVKSAASSASSYESITAKFEALWAQIALRFKDQGDFLIFEAFNELHDGSWGWGENRTDGGAQYAVINKWVQVFVNVVRGTEGNNSTRFLGIPGYCANPDLTMEHLIMPEDSAEGRLLLAVHCYDPYDYTLECKYDEWGHTAKNNACPYGEKEVVEVLARLKAKYVDNGIPVYFGETGCSNRATERQIAFMSYYMEFFYKACKNYAIAPFFWDNGAVGTGRETSALIDHTNGEYINNGKVMVEAMRRAIVTAKESYTLRSVYNAAP